MDLIEDKYKIKLENDLKNAEINEVNLTDTDGKTIKFGAYQGTNVGYNIQATVYSKNKLVNTFKVTNNSSDQ